MTSTDSEDTKSPESSGLIGTIEYHNPSKSLRTTWEVFRGTDIVDEHLPMGRVSYPKNIPGQLTFGDPTGVRLEVQIRRRSKKKRKASESVDEKAKPAKAEEEV